VFHGTNELKNMIPQGKCDKFPKEIWLLEANGHKYPKTISPHSFKNHVFPWQMGPNSPKQKWFPDVPSVPKAIHVPWGTLGPFASSLVKTSRSNSLLPREFASTYFASQGNMAKEVRSSCMSQHQPLLEMTSLKLPSKQIIQIMFLFSAFSKMVNLR
jgi:hypothetical protein